jgi:hypothetical protein
MPSKWPQTRHRTAADPSHRRNETPSRETFLYAGRLRITAPPLNPWPCCIVPMGVPTGACPNRHSCIQPVPKVRRTRWRQPEDQRIAPPRFRYQLEVPLRERMAVPTVASSSASVLQHLFPTRGLRPRILPHSSIAWLSLSPILGHELGITATN